MTVLVRAAALSNYGHVARQVGLDPTKMLRRAKLDPAVLKNPDLRVPAGVVAALLEESAAQSGCEARAQPACAEGAHAGLRDADWGVADGE